MRDQLTFLEDQQSEDTMAFTRLLSILLCLCYGCVFVFAASPCLQSPYSQFTHLSTYTVAQKFCTLYYPLPPVTKTVTTAVYTRVKRQASTAAANAASNCNSDCQQWKALASKATSFLKTLCSCIETPKTVTVTKTTTKTTTTSTPPAYPTCDGIGQHNVPYIPGGGKCNCNFTLNCNTAGTEGFTYQFAASSKEACRAYVDSNQGGQVAYYNTTSKICYVQDYNLPSYNNIPRPGEEIDIVDIDCRNKCLGPVLTTCDSSRTDYYTISNVPGGGKCGCPFTIYCNAYRDGGPVKDFSLPSSSACRAYVDSSAGDYVASYDASRGHCIVQDPSLSFDPPQPNPGFEVEEVSRNCKAYCDGPSPPPICDPARTDQYIVNNVPSPNGLCGCTFTVYCNTIGSSPHFGGNGPYRVNADGCRFYLDSIKSNGNAYVDLSKTCVLLGTADTITYSYAAGYEVEVIDQACHSACTALQ